MGFLGVLWKNNIQKAHFPKINIPVQIVFEILAQLCSGNSIQIFLPRLYLSAQVACAKSIIWNICLIGLRS